MGANAKKNSVMNINPRGAAVRRLAVSAALTVVFAVASVHSTLFIFVHAGHAHGHGVCEGSCAVCAHLLAAGSLVSSFSPPVAGASHAAVRFAPSPVNPNVALSYNGVSTPVLLKVKLNN
jgi:hypothetical protein